MTWPDRRSKAALDDFITGRNGAAQMLDDHLEVIDMAECPGCHEMVEEEMILTSAGECYYCHEEVVNDRVE